MSRASRSYLRLIPRVWGQLQRNLSHPALADLRAICDAVLPDPDPRPPAEDRKPMPAYPFPLMIFAAGFGTRMGALTADRPKPLIPVAGRALIDHALAWPKRPGSARMVVNTHYRAEQMAAHLAGRGRRDQPRSRTDPGNRRRPARPRCRCWATGPVAILNSDGIWTGANPLAELAAAWDGDRMEALLLLLPLHQTLAHGPKGDFRLDAEGRLSRGAGGEDHVYIGAQIIEPGPYCGDARRGLFAEPALEPDDRGGHRLTAWSIRAAGAMSATRRGLPRPKRLLHSAGHG